MAQDGGEVRTQVRPPVDGATGEAGHRRGNRLADDPEPRVPQSPPRGCQPDHFRDLQRGALDEVPEGERVEDHDVFGIDRRSPPGEHGDELAEIGGVRGGDECLPFRLQRCRGVLQQPHGALQMLDEIAEDDDFELPGRIVVEHVPRHHVVAKVLQSLHIIGQIVDADAGGAHLADPFVQPIGVSVGVSVGGTGHSLRVSSTLLVT